MKISYSNKHARCCIALGLACLSISSLWATHVALKPKQKVEFAQSRIEALKTKVQQDKREYAAVEQKIEEVKKISKDHSQLPLLIQRLADIKKRVEQLLKEIAISENSVRPLQTHVGLS